MISNNINYSHRKDLKPILTIVLLLMVFCIMGLLAGRSYADSRSQAVFAKDIIDEAIAINDDEPDTAETLEKWQTVHMRVTAYCPCPKCCGKFSDGITASGHKIYNNDTFAAADKRYAFRTKMIIPGYNNGSAIEVLDRGGAIRGNRLDVFFNSHQEALNWGVRYLDVKILCE